LELEQSPSRQEDETSILHQAKDLVREQRWNQLRVHGQEKIVGQTAKPDGARHGLGRRLRKPHQEPVGGAVDTRERTGFEILLAEPRAKP
jgi:hypothetical protein